MDSIRESLDDPPNLASEKWKAAQLWYSGCRQSEREHIQVLMLDAVISALHGVLVFLDGATAHHYIGERPADFYLGINVYPDVDAAPAHPEESVQICPSDEGMDLHYIFLNQLDDAEIGT